MFSLASGFDQARRRGDWLVQRAADRIASVPGGEGAILAAIGSQGTAGSLGGLQRAASLQQHQEQLRHNTGVVYTCASAIAKRVCRQPLRVARRAKAKKRGQKSLADLYRAYTLKRTLPGSFKTYHEDLDVLDSHPILDTVMRPNQIMVRWMLLFHTVISLKLTGKAYWWIQRDKNAPSGSGYTIWPVPAHWLEAVHLPNQLYHHWQLRVEGSMQVHDIPAEEIVYFYYPDPSNPLGALSPLQAIARAVVADEAISEAQRRTFANGIWPGLAITIGRHPEAKLAGGVQGERPALSKEQRGMIMAAIKQAYRGVQHYDEPIILDAIVESVAKISNTAREMDFLKSKEVTATMIHKGFGVNPIVTGEMQDANYASSATADMHFLANTVNPDIELLSEILTAVLPTMFGDTSGELYVYLEEGQSFDPVLDLDWNKFLQSVGVKGGNELRLDRGLPPIHGGDIAMIQGTLVPVHVVREDSPEPDGPAFKPGETEDDQPEPPAPVVVPAAGKPAQDGKEPPGQEEPKEKRFRSADALVEWFYRAA